jgi:hypothetical protein
MKPPTTASVARRPETQGGLSGDINLPPAQEQLVAIICFSLFLCQ